MELTKVVGRFVPFHWTVAPEAKFEPLTVSVKVELPAVADEGAKLVIVGEFAGVVAGQLAVAPGGAKHTVAEKGLSFWSDPEMVPETPAGVTVNAPPETLGHVSNRQVSSHGLPSLPVPIQVV